MLVRRTVVLSLLSAWLATAGAQTEYRIDTDPPRLLLPARRLRLLQRERSRQSMRWEQFDALVRGQARLSEPGFVLALYYRVAGDEAAARRAVQWALGPGADLRQQALVLDWCRPVMSSEELASLATRLKQALAGSADDSVPAVRSRAFAAVALADLYPEDAAAEIRRIIEPWWRAGIVASLRQGRDLPRTDHYALFELLHVIRDNLQIDLREDVPWYFKDLPIYRLMTYYPAAYPAAENEYRIPASVSAQPDLTAAMLSRAADLAMVAYEPNAQETQFLQGWVMQDRYLMRHPFGIPYEFLWANPYHPGLTYHSLPLTYYDARFGRLFLRSSWEEDAVWLGCFDDQVQMFADGRPQTLRAAPRPVRIADAVVFVADGLRRFTAPADAGRVFIVGLKRSASYDVEIDDQEMREERADRGGILALPAGVWGGVRLRERAPAPAP